jgi:hypothetical protein
MLNRRCLALLAAALAVVPAAGCGGSDSTTTALIGKAEFIKKANAICTKDAKKMHADFVAFSTEHNDNPSPSKSEYEEFIAKVIEPHMTRQISEIRALGTPKGDKRTAEEILSAVEEGLQKAKEKPELVTTHNIEIFGKAIRLATAYGLAACAQTY